jgi:hypothetical protein
MDRRPRALTLEQLDRAYVADRWQKTPKAPIPVQPFMWAEKLWINTGGCSQYGHKSCEVTPLLPVEEFRAAYPGRKLTLQPEFTDASRAAGDSYFGVRVSVRKAEYVIGPPAEERQLTTVPPSLSATAATLPPVRVPANEVPPQLRIGQRVLLHAAPLQEGILVSISARAGDTAATHCVSWDRQPGERKGSTTWHEPGELEAADPEKAHGQLPVASATSGTCRICNCTSENCQRCVERTGEPCQWVDAAQTLCTACETLAATPLSELNGIPTKMMARLYRAGYATVGDVAGKRPEDLAGVRGGDAMQVCAEVEKWLRDRLTPPARPTAEELESLAGADPRPLCAVCTAYGELCDPVKAEVVVEDLDDSDVDLLLPFAALPDTLQAVFRREHGLRDGQLVCVGCAAKWKEIEAGKRKGKKGASAK